MNIERLKEIIEKSDLDSKAKKEMISFWQKMQDKDLAELIKLFEKDPTWIKKIYRNIKLKQQAITKKDTDFWNKILEEEEKELSSL